MYFQLIYLKINFMKKIYLLSFLLITFATSFAQSIFDNTITGTNPNTSNPYITGQTVNTNITVSGISRGTGIVGVNANDRYNASSWNSPALDLNDYFEFTLTPNASFEINFISFAFTLQRSATGPTSAALRSSLDGYTTDIGTVTTALTPGVLNTVDLSAPAYQNINAAITFRVYGWAATAAGGTLSVNDFIFNGLTGVLPINISYLNGTKQNGSHNLNWKVNCSSSQNVNMFIERSADARNFKVINSITADGIRCLQPFDYTDNAPLPGNNFYRLKTVDENGKITYSTIALVINKTDGFDIAGILPSLINNSTAVLNASAAKKVEVTVVVTDLLGRQVQQNSYSLIAGSNQIPMNFSKLAAGTYQLVGYTTEGKSKTIRFVKQ
jgi:hypothetical protein